MLADKPIGVTSHDVVAAARRAYGERRIGHAGTLDPFATGLLVLLLGRATRLLSYLEGEPKVYDATIRFGEETTTDDLTGEVLRTAPAPSLEEIERVIPALTGTIDQLPPAYSAKQRGGVRAYDAARRGDALELSPVPVVVHGWQVLSWRAPFLDARITCAGGTYVRALARDLGRLTSSAAHLTALRRARSGSFDVADALSFDTLREGSRPPLSPLAAIPSLPTERLTPDESARVRRGQRLPATGEAPRAALLDDGGALVAIAERDGGEWQPRVVFGDD